MADTRERMITSTALLVRERGARATSRYERRAAAGAIAFCVFFFVLLRRMRAPVR